MRFPYFLNPVLLKAGALVRKDIWWKLPAAPDSTRVFLTFDDGPGGAYMPQVLEVLREEKVRATFFVLGDRCELFHEVLREAARDGHGLALHGDCHLEFTHRESQAFVERLATNRAQLEAALGDDSKLQSAIQPYFRPPKGKITPAQVRQARDVLGLQTVNCSRLAGVATIAGTGSPGWFEDPEKSASRMSRGLRAGEIIALHCGETISPLVAGPYDNLDIYNMPQATETVRQVIRAIRENHLEPDRLPCADTLIK